MRAVLQKARLDSAEIPMAGDPTQPLPSFCARVLCCSYRFISQSDLPRDSRAQSRSAGLHLLLRAQLLHDKGKDLPKLFPLLQLDIPAKPHPWFSRLQQRNPNASESTGTWVRSGHEPPPQQECGGWECSRDRGGVYIFLSGHTVPSKCCCPPERSSLNPY